jgi:osmotically-inducible protein OsmY
MKRTIDYWKNRQNILQRLALIVCVAAVPVTAGLLATGCAGDRYHESTGEDIDDTAITARVKHALNDDPTFKYDDVHVTTFKGGVQLSGFVVSEDARHHAEQLAKNADGVKDVTDSIQLR